jgi:N-acetylmuramoyl-L-alanine amidase
MPASLLPAALTEFAAGRCDNGAMRTNRVPLLVVLAGLVAGCSPEVDLERKRAIAAVAPEGAGSPASTTSDRPVVGGAAVTATGVVVPVLDAAAGGWTVGTPCGKSATVRTLRAVSGTVVLDAGHGGRETGAVGPLGHRESDLNLAVAAHAREALGAAGVPVVSTRTDDYRSAITARAAIVKAVKPRAAVSIHHNASYAHLQDTPGTEVFHQAMGTGATESRRLAGLLYEEVTQALGSLGLSRWAATPWAGVKPRRNDEGEDFYGILRRTQGAPTTLLEVGFISRKAEERLYAEAEVQAAVGQAIARGVVRFLTTADPGSGYVTPPPMADDHGLGGGTEGCQDPRLE